MEKICFELENIEMNYLDKEIVKIDRLAVHQFDRIGIVGKNGAGKSTILKLFAGLIQPTSGKVHRHVTSGYFEQLEAPKEVTADPALLGKLNVPKELAHLSGGEQTRAKLAALFTDYNEALLIDEPTTHLDQAGIHYLTEELKYYYGALVLISHDRVLLDELVTTIWEVADGEIRIFSGNYSNYVDVKQLEGEQQIQQHERYLKEKSRLEDAAAKKMKKAEKIAQANRMTKRETKDIPNKSFMTKSKGTGQKSMQRAAKAIESRMEQLEVVEAMKESRPIIFQQAKALELHNKFPIMADRFTLKTSQKILLNEASFQFPLGKKIAITGANGTGKSTLLEHIAQDGAGLIISPKAKIGYFHQLGYRFKQNETVIQFLKKRSEHEEGFLRTVLHTMQFIGTDIQKNIRNLSGGEAIRLQLCQLFLGKYNILLLDEPTNFLDLDAVKAVEKFILAYQATIIFVSHDRQFINNVADMKFHLKEQQLKME